MINIHLIITSLNACLSRENHTYPLDYVPAINTKAFIRYCFLARYQFKKNDTKTIDITLVRQLL